MLALFPQKEEFVEALQRPYSGNFEAKQCSSGQWKLSVLTLQVLIWRGTRPIIVGKPRALEERLSQRTKSVLSSGALGTERLKEPQCES